MSAAWRSCAGDRLAIAFIVDSNVSTRVLKSSLGKSLPTLGLPHVFGGVAGMRRKRSVPSATPRARPNHGAGVNLQLTAAAPAVVSVTTPLMNMSLGTMSLGA